MKLSKNLLASLNGQISTTATTTVTGTTGKIYNLDEIIASIRRDNPDSPLVIPSKYDGQIVEHLIALILNDYKITVPTDGTSLETLAQQKVDGFFNVLNRYIESYYPVYKENITAISEGSISLDSVINKIDIAHDEQVNILTDKTLSTQSSSTKARAFVSNGSDVPTTVTNDSAEIFFDHVGVAYIKTYYETTGTYSYKQITAGDDENTVNKLKAYFEGLLANKLNTSQLTQDVVNDTDHQSLIASSAATKAAIDALATNQAKVDAEQDKNIKGLTNYLNDTLPVPTDIGGIKAGTTYATGVSINNILTSLLYPTVLPVINSVDVIFKDESTNVNGQYYRKGSSLVIKEISISGRTGGTATTGNISCEGSSVSSEKKFGNTYCVDIDGDVYRYDSSQESYLTAADVNSDGNIDISVYLTDSKGNKATKTVSYHGVYDIYYGTTALTTGADYNSKSSLLSGDSLIVLPAINCTENKAMIAIPNTMTLTEITDERTNSNVFSLFNKTTVDNYNVYVMKENITGRFVFDLIF